MTALVPGHADPEVIDGLASFVAEVVAPLEAKHAQLLADPRQRYSSTGSYCEEVLVLQQGVRKASAEAGYYTMFAPTELGGEGRGALLHYQIWENLFRTCGPDRVLPYHAVAHPAGGPTPVLKHLRPELASEVLQGLMSGEHLLCVALSERYAGSDPWSITTTATRRQGRWVISGAKHWVSRAPYARYVLVLAVTDRARVTRRAGGITAFLLPINTPGVRVDSVTRLLGRIGGEEATVLFDAVHADDRHIVGEVHEGLATMGSAAALAATYTAGRFVGLARWALERTVQHSTEATASDRAPSRDTSIGLRLADSAMEIYAAHRMALDCAHRLDQGAPAQKEAAIVKAYAPEMCSRVYERCMQVHGGMGLTSETKLFDGWHQARIVLAADGGAETNRRHVTERLLQGDLSF